MHRIGMALGMLLVIASVGVLTVLLAGTAAGATWIVDDDGGADFASIRTAQEVATQRDLQGVLLYQVTMHT